MAYLNYLLWAYFLVYPVFVYLTHEQEKQKVLADQKALKGIYRATILHLWAPTLVLLSMVYFSDLDMSDIGVYSQWGLGSQIGLFILVLIAGYFIFALRQLRNGPDDHQAIKEQLAHVRWFMPTNITESRYFIFGVSVSAGICEELLFRGYLLHLLDEYLPVYAAVIISSIAFGLGHIYQGAANVVRAAILGAVMALIYLLTDSIIIVVLLHIFLDMYGGAMAYIVCSNSYNKPLSAQNS